jgi:DNA polymerase-3 subunit delta'
MEAVEPQEKAWDGIRRSCEAGRLAHAYIVVGSPGGEALPFVESFLQLLFCGETDKPCRLCPACRQVEAHTHVDTLWIEPQSKSRQITAGEIRGLIQRLSQTSFEGGWKAAVILAADCMNAAASNILLKTLEEPPADTILLLVTDAPQSLLPTIISRCQKIALTGLNEKHHDAVWHDPVMDLLHALPPANGLEAARLAGQLKAIFDRIKAGIADSVAEGMNEQAEGLDESKIKEILEARTSALLKEVQADVFRVVLEWQRDVLMLASGIPEEHLNSRESKEQLRAQASRHTPASAMDAVSEVDSMARRLERSIPELQVFDEGFRRLVRS